MDLAEAPEGIARSGSLIAEDRPSARPTAHPRGVGYKPGRGATGTSLGFTGNSLDLPRHTASQPSNPDRNSTVVCVPAASGRFFWARGLQTVCLEKRPSRPDLERRGCRGHKMSGFTGCAGSRMFRYTGSSTAPLRRPETGRTRSSWCGGSFPDSDFCADEEACHEHCKLDWDRRSGRIARRGPRNEEGSPGLRAAQKPIVSS